MCCLFGVVNYSGYQNDNINDIINYLSEEATIRGSHSTGIAYNRNGNLVVYKEPKSGYEMYFKGLNDCVCVTGHTRYATQGSYKKNYNNHPFSGKCDNSRFALCHNGVLWNDDLLRKQYDIPDSKIETDSYIAVQLLEHFHKLNVDNVAKMAELVQGSYTFTMVDNSDTLWIVKGDSPFSLIHFPHLKLYVYASTIEILFSAISQTSLVHSIANSLFEIIPVNGGDIIQINKYGEMTVNHFEFFDYDSWRYNWRSYGNYNYYDDDNSYESTYNSGKAYDSKEYEKQWLEDLKVVARGVGLEPEDIEQLHNDGYSLDEIEDLLYS